MYTLTDNWLHTVHMLLHSGENAYPRGNLTKEILGNNIRIDMKHPILCVPERHLGTAFLCFEPYWVLTGDNRLDSIKPYAAMMERFSDDGIFLSGAYGPKLIDQLPYVIKCLKTDINSRQAIINIWREKPGATADCPCTCIYQFFIRNMQLNMVIYMRSSDIYLGVPYDVFTQTMIAFAVCLLLRKSYNDLEMGKLILNMGSSHLYGSDISKVEEILKSYDTEKLFFGRNIERELKYDYSLSFEDLKEYLLHCSKELANNLSVGDCFLKGLQPKGSAFGVLI